MFYSLRVVVAMKSMVSGLKRTTDLLSLSVTSTNSFFPNDLKTLFDQSFTIRMCKRRLAISAFCNLQFRIVRLILNVLILTDLRIKILL